MRINIFLMLIFFNAISYASVVTDSEIKKLKQGEIIIKQQANEYSGGQNSRTYIAIAIFKTDIDTIFNILTDFKTHPEFMPDLKSIIVNKREDGVITTDNTIGLPLGKVKKYRLLFKLNKKDSDAQISWKMIDWPEVPKLQSIDNTIGYWKFEKDKRVNDGIIVTYYVFTDPGEIPFGLGWIVDYFTEESIPKVLTNTRRYLSKKTE